MKPVILFIVCLFSLFAVLGCMLGGFWLAAAWDSMVKGMLAGGSGAIVFLLLFSTAMAHMDTAEAQGDI